MNTLEAIAQRRSTRKFKPDPVPDDLVRQVLLAATQAPSGKNRQPWRFIVVRGETRATMVQVMRQGIANLKSYGIDPGSAEWSANVMEQAPVTVFVFNTGEEDIVTPRGFPDNLMNIVDVQSIGAAIQNMLLAAHDLGLGSLWICDVFSAYRELCEWLGETHQLIAAVSLGYADEHPNARPRHPVDEVTLWR